MTTELENLKKQVAELRQRIDPEPRQRSNHQPYDPTEGFSMPRSALKAMVEGVPDRLMNELRSVLATKSDYWRR